MGTTEPTQSWDLETLSRWLTSFVPGDLPPGHDDRTTARNLVLTCFGGATFSAISIPLHRLIVGEWAPAWPIHAGLAAAVFVLPFVMRRSRRVVSTALVMLALVVVALAMAVSLEGGLRSPTLPWIVATGFLGALNLPVRYAFWGWIPLALTTGIVVAMDLAGVTKQPAGLLGSVADRTYGVVALGLLIALWVASARRHGAHVVALLEVREAELRRQRTELDTVVSHLPLALLSVDSMGRVYSASGSAADRVLGKSTNSNAPWPNLNERIPDLADLIRSASDDLVRHRQIRVGEHHFQAWARAGQADESGRGSVYAVLQDITEQREAEQRRALADIVFETSAHGLFVADHLGRFRRINPAYARITGHSETTLAGQAHPLIDRTGATMTDETTAVLGELEFRGRWESESTQSRANGELYVQRLTLMRLPDSEDGTRPGVMGMVTDVTESRRAREKLKQLADNDELTGLPNRRHFLGELSRLIDRAREEDESLALLFVDLDGFKNVNDSLGHAAGDSVLVEVSRRLEQCIREGDALGRLAGDEFTIAMHGRVRRAAAEQTAARIIEVIGEPIACDGGVAAIGASVGIALFPEHARERDELVVASDAAMYAAKKAGRNQYVVFNEAISEEVERTAALHDRLQRAIEQTEFELVWQPYADLSTGSILGVEALVRWIDPELGLVLPAQFLSTIDDLGLALRFRTLVLNMALAQGAAWRADATWTGLVNVNLSTRQVPDEDLGTEVQRALEHYDFPADRLELELSESLFSEEEPQVTRAIQAVRKLGVRLAIDDFGTGRSSLYLLQRQQIDRIKVDGAFVSGLASRSDARAIVRGIVSIGRALQASITGEMVEEVSDLRALVELGCDSAQGFLLASPRAPHELENLLRTGRMNLPLAPAPPTTKGTTKQRDRGGDS